MDKVFYNLLRKNFIQLNTKETILQVEALISCIKNTDLLKDKLYKHPLGFCYSTLYQFENKDSFRLHIWYNNMNIKLSNLFIHNHYYTITSFIIMGKMLNTTYNIYPASNKSTHTKYIGSYKNRNERILQKSKENYIITKRNEMEINPKKFYKILKSEYHTATVNPNIINCSLVYTSESDKPNPIVFGDINGEFEYYFKSELVTNKEITIIKNKLKLC